jgi:hypothetical protein
MAWAILINLVDWAAFMRKQNRRMGSKADVEAILAL